MVTGFGSGHAAPAQSPSTAPGPTNFFALEAPALDGTPTPFSTFAGKVVLVVNVASRCGYTPQYDDLEKVWKEYRDRGLVVVGFPCNDFGGQEPGSAKEIGEFCRATYGVTFPMMGKVQTKAGAGQSPVYAFLSAKVGKLPSWNFGKYLVGRDGQPIEFFGSGAKPTGAELRAAIERALAGSVTGGGASGPAAPSAPSVPSAPSAPAKP